MELFLEQDQHPPSFLQLCKVTRAHFPVSNAEAMPFGTSVFGFSIARLISSVELLKLGLLLRNSVPLGPILTGRINSL